MKRIFTITMLLSMLAMTAPLTADAFIPIRGEGTLGFWEGAVDYSYTNSTSAELEVKLKNISPADNDGYITAFVLNNPFDYITDIELNATDSDFNLIGGAAFDNAVNAAPYGQFDFGASTSNSRNGNSAFLGGGNPNKGIAVGDEETFTFKLTGSQLDTLTDHVFLSTLSISDAVGQKYKNFVVRFRGFEDGGSDKVYKGHHLPEPATMAMFGLGAAGAFIRKRFA